MAVVTGTGTTAPTDRPEEPRRRIRFSISVVLAVIMGGMVLVASLAIYQILWVSSRDNLISLMSDKSRLLLDITEGEVRDQLEPAEHQLREMAQIMVRTGVHPGTDERQFFDLLRGALSALPQVRTVLFWDPLAETWMADRDLDWITTHRFSEVDDPNILEVIDAAKGRRDSWWGRPEYVEEFDTTVINVRQPVWIDDTFYGVLLAAVTVDELSYFLRDQATQHPGFTPFILADRDHVIAVPSLAGDENSIQRSEDQPLPSLAEVDQPVLAQIWKEEIAPHKIAIEVLRRVGGHAVELDPDVFGEDRYEVFLYRELDTFSVSSWWVGLHVDADILGSELDRMIRSAGAAFVVLILGVLVAVFVGKRVARPIRRAATSANRIATLDFDRIERLPRSRIRELDDGARSFNSMISGLQWFERYVPKTLVHRLFDLGVTDAMQSEQRVVTIMFTDLAGFSTMSEQMPAPDVARLLNAHFELVTRCIEAEGGTVDKFMGDGAMAFWGAPEAMQDHAARACRAARAIAECVRSMNRDRIAAGDEPLRMRVGVHTGPVVVGNIGASTRMNYTIVSDAVNIGQRVEQLGKQIDPTAEITVLLTVDTASVVNDESILTDDVGSYPVKGRREPVEILRLRTDQDPSS